jgi:hypothetical protein
MSFADCDFFGSGEASDQHAGCVKMAGHIGPHKDCFGREWYTQDQEIKANEDHTMQTRV